MVGFSRKDAKRIAKVVRRVERSSINGRPRFRRRSGATTSRPQRSTAIARLGGSLAACDTTANDLLHPSFAGMPSATGIVYMPALDSGNLKWAEGQGKTIYNATPFAYDNGEDVCIANVGGYWLVERARTWQPAAHLQCGTVGIVNPVRWASLPYHKGDIIRRENSNGRIVVNAPVSSQPFRLQLRLRVGQPAGQTDWRGELQLHGNLYGTSSVDLVAFGPSSSISGNSYLELGYDEIVNWSRDDYFEIHLYDASGNAPSADFGYLTITPMF